MALTIAWGASLNSMRGRVVGGAVVRSRDGAGGVAAAHTAAQSFSIVTIAS